MLRQDVFHGERTQKHNDTKVLMKEKLMCGSLSNSDPVIIDDQTLKAHRQKTLKFNLNF